MAYKLRGYLDRMQANSEEKQAFAIGYHNGFFNNERKEAGLPVSDKAKQVREAHPKHYNSGWWQGDADRREGWRL